MLPTPINWLQRPTMPHSWQITEKFSQFLLDFIGSLPEISPIKITDDEKTGLESEYFENFKTNMLAWAGTQFWSVKAQDSDWRAFSYFQTAVFSEMKQWFKDNQASLKVRYLDKAAQSRTTTPVDMDEQFFDWIRSVGLGRQPHITFDGFASGILFNNFSQAILSFFIIGGELFGIESFESIAVAHSFKDGVQQVLPKQMSEWQSFCLPMINNYIEFIDGNLGFEGLGSLFG